MPRLTLTAIAALTLGAVLAAGGALSASAAVTRAAGLVTSPSQPYLHNSNPSDWLGSYTVGGEQAWATLFGYNDPDSTETLNAPAPAETKWNTAIDPAVANALPYLLWRYGETQTNNEAAALAQIIYSWLDAPQNPGELSAANDFRHIAYDSPFHLAKLPSAAQTLVQSMSADAALYGGPWTVELVSPTAQTVGSAGPWTLRILSATGNTVPSVPVQITVTDAELSGGVATLSLVTPADGSALSVPVTPTGVAPTVTADLDAPVTTVLSQTTTDPTSQTVLLRSSNVTPLSSTVAGTATIAPASATPATPALASTGAGLNAIVPFAGLLAFVTGVSLLWFVRRRRVVQETTAARRR